MFHMMERRVFTASVPVELEYPWEMEIAIRKVLDGEYDAPYDGSGLTILDIGANVGSFTRWANLRWPDSTIHSFEPEPTTYETLVRNVDGLANVRTTRSAVFPTDESHLSFYSRYPGDGEAGLVDLTTFEDVQEDKVTRVPVVHPRDLPQDADIIKVDAEGAEAAILEGFDLSRVSLVMVEYQTRDDHRRIKELCSNDFVIETETSAPWEALAGQYGYRADLAGEVQGVMVFANRRTKLRKRGTEPLPREADPRSLKAALRPLPPLMRAAVRRRLPQRG